jgi:flagellar hook assembly protein FlgD
MIECVINSQARAEFSIVSQNGETVVSKQIHLLAGKNTIEWNGRYEDGGIVPSGEYYYMIRSDVGIMRGNLIIAR